MYIVQKPTGIYVGFCISPYRGYKTYTTNPTNKLKNKYTNAGIISARIIHLQGGTGLKIS
jgi:hypothetical protein